MTCLLATHHMQCTEYLCLLATHNMQCTDYFLYWYSGVAWSMQKYTSIIYYLIVGMYYR